jgi:dTDP-4-amino-4,6-dideoxygalactose transaminase
VTINSGDEQDFLTAHAFADKNFKRFGDTVQKDLHYLAPNYRMTELQGAVGIAQLKKLPWICERRHVHGDRITQGISGLPGVIPHKVQEGNECTYWFYMMRIDESQLTCDRAEFSKALAAEGIPNQAGYIPQVMYLQPIFQKRQAYLGSHFPFDITGIEYKEGDCPNAENILKTAIRFSVNEFYTDQDIEDIIRAIRKVANHYAKVPAKS